MGGSGLALTPEHWEELAHGASSVPLGKAGTSHRRGPHTAVSAGPAAALGLLSLQVCEQKASAPTSAPTGLVSQ